MLLIRFDALPPGHAKPACKECGHETGYLVCYVMSDGRPSLRIACEWCEKVSTTFALPRTLLGSKPDLNRLPTIDNSQVSELPPCAVCDMQAQEWHHWAPRVIFPDWPDVGVYLCRSCHTDWHNRMRAHGLRWPGELKPATPDEQSKISPPLDPMRGAEVARQLRALGAKRILVRAAELGYITAVRCAMPKCWCPEELGGAEYFEAVTSELSDWSPTHEHYPIPKREGGRETVDNAVLAHRLCNRMDFSITSGRSHKRDLERIERARQAAAGPYTRSSGPRPLV
jgi:hypothetical protein